MPPDYAVRPHHHPAAEEVRLLEGTLHLGHGAKWDEKALSGGDQDTPGNQWKTVERTHG
jgi:hypothetical protein